MEYLEVYSQSNYISLGFSQYNEFDPKKFLFSDLVIFIPIIILASPTSFMAKLMVNKHLTIFIT